MSTLDTTLQNVLRVYSGKPGCMCGCRGNYKEAYNVSNARSVKIIYNKVMNNPAHVVDGDCAYVLTPTRNLVVYFNA